MKAILRFDLDDPQDRDEHEMALKASAMAGALFEIRQRMFRPARKHGFSDEYLNKVNENNPELFETLEKMFNEICEEHDVNQWT